MNEWFTPNNSYSLKGVREANYYVLKYTHMPAGIVETSFISNPTDAEKLAFITFRQQLDVQYAQGMHEFW
ncbi:N-acetylmuramoyl-L-alanine amidase family protein [Bacillus massilinigeriensis]|uniref:N-acetylmuramoyl-L-alanine amidase family protein n=1 Tax=Bacillus massilionigeriensis TaxID=1805475 RepID=UPI00096B3642|nr:N-acetylmuramoyl-L-alanine amidase [Bacillus massilionigeriensis]